MPKGILALDIDGTTVRDDNEMGKRTRTALQRAKEAGWVVCFVTGRRDVDMIPFGDRTQYAHYLILNNGGKLIRVSDGVILHNEVMGSRDCERLVERCLSEDWLLYVVSGKRVWANKKSAQVSEYERFLGFDPTLYRCPRDLPLCELEGFMATCDAQQIVQVIDEEALHLTYVFSEPTCADIMRKGLNKWRTIQRLASMLAVPSERIVAVGNYNNDLEMIEQAGVGVAVQNALPVVKEAADYVTRRDNNNDAVAEVVERFVLLENRS